MEEEKKKRMEQKILQNDEKVRRLTTLWMAQHSDILARGETERVQTGRWHGACKHRATADGD